MHRSTIWRRARSLAAGLTGVGLALASLAAISPPAAAATLDSLAISGHGYGHGRGMGQYGAYGYALEGESYPWILAHYYGGTTPATVNPNQIINVTLSEFDAAAHIQLNGPGGDTVVTEYNITRFYKGKVVVTGNTVHNLVPLDQYVAGVVPAESPSSWGTNGMAALQAQAVAARSYALASLRASGTVCDTTYCQVYDGDPDVAGSPTYSGYQTYSDKAVTSTAGQVLVCAAGSSCGPAGSVALTEFSSSTGGYSAGGAFPAVVDQGDGVAAAGNPNHTWTTTVAASTVEAAYPTIGSLQSVVVTQRNGFGDWGGRVEQLVVTGSAGSVTTTGPGFAASMALRSDWFTVTPVIAVTTPVATPPAAAAAPASGSAPAAAHTTRTAGGGTNGYWVVSTSGAVSNFGAAPPYGSMVGQHLNGPIVAMAPTANQQGYWLVGSDGGIFTFGDARFYGSTGALHLNRPVLGMAATPGGGGYWLVASDGGIFTFGDAKFYGSTGALQLNQPIVAMAATPDGRGYWLVAADGGIFTFGDAKFYGSTGAMHLSQPIVGMVPTADGRGYTLVGRDGGIFTFGDATFDGSLPGRGIAATVTGVTPTADGGGYLMSSSTGNVYVFGDAQFFGDLQTAIPGWSGTALGVFARKG